MISFYTAKLLSLLVYPVSLSLLLLALAFACSLLRWRRISFYTTVIAVTWLYLCSTALFANFLMGSLERSYVPRAMSVIAEADAIVLLGGAMRGDTHMGTLADLNQHADRLVHAAALYKAGKAPIILLTGGGGEDVRSEAEQMREILMVMGISGAQHVAGRQESHHARQRCLFCADAQGQRAASDSAGKLGLSYAPGRGIIFGAGVGGCAGADRLSTDRCATTLIQVGARRG